MRIDPIIVQGLIWSAILFAAIMGIEYLIVLAHATTESDYQYGYEGGAFQWNSCAHTHGEGDCTYAHDFCTNIITYANGTTVNTSPIHDVKACVDGYAQAWDKSCSTGAKADVPEPCPLSQHDLT